MSTSVMVSLLRKGQTGNEILEILDAICEDQSNTPVAQYAPNSGTLEELQFWSLCDAYSGGNIVSYPQMSSIV